MFGGDEKPKRKPHSEDLIEGYEDLLDQLRNLPETRSQQERIARENIVFAILRAIYQLEKGKPFPPLGALGLRHQTDVLKLKRIPNPFEVPEKPKRLKPQNPPIRKAVPGFDQPFSTSHTLSRMTRTRRELTQNRNVHDASPPASPFMVRQHPLPAVQQWEYCWIDVDEASYVIVYSEVDGRHDRREAGHFDNLSQMKDDLMRVIAQLGKSGWELVSQNKHATFERYTFKRSL